MKIPQFDRLSHWQSLALLGLIAYVFLMMGNGIVTLTHPDEVFYVQTAKEMVAHGSWMTPYIFDQPQFEKPVFFYWLLAGAIKFFGLNPFWARFWPAFFAIVGVLTAYGMSWHMFRSRRAAFLSGFVLATSLIWLVLARAVLTDMVFSVLVFLSLFSFYWGYANRQWKSAGIILTCVFSGLAVLTKGLLGVLFPFGTILLFLLYEKDLKYLRSWSTLAGIMVFAAIALPWHILMYKLYGQEFIAEYWSNVHVRRVYDAEHQKSNTWYFYLMSIFTGVFPWSFFLVPVVWGLARQLKQREGNGRIAFLVLWIAVVFWIVQSAQSKLASYHLPLFPAVVILIGYYFDRMLSESNQHTARRIFHQTVYVMAGLLFVAAIGGIVAAHKYIAIIVHPGPIYVFAGLAVVLGSTMIFFNRQKKAGVCLFLNSLIVMLILVTLFLGRPYAEPWVSCHQVGEALNKIDRSDSVVLASKFYVRGVCYYTDRKMAVIDINGKGFFSPHPIPFLNTDDEVEEFLESQPVTYAVVKESNVEDLQRIAGDRFRITELYGEGGKYILKIEK